jgi:ABC-type Mn/Zn transport systems, ATPase component
LDAENKAIVHKMLNEFNSRGLTILRVTHDESEIEDSTDKITIKNGEVQDV